MRRRRRQNVDIGEGSCGQGLAARGWWYEQNATYSIHYSNMLVLFMAWMMGMYFVSSVLLMRMNLPLVYRKAITQVRGFPCMLTALPRACRCQVPVPRG